MKQTDESISAFPLINPKRFRFRIFGKRSLLAIIFAIGIILIQEWKPQWLSPPTQPIPASVTVMPTATISATLATVTRVIDGDTIQIATGEKVRYIGVNTPETVDPRRPVQCYGHEGSAENKKLVEGKEVRLEKDVSNTDKYGRLLRYVWVGDVMVNEFMVREGFAQVSTYPPDVKYKDRFVAAEKLAQAENKGFWGSSCNTTP